MSPEIRGTVSDRVAYPVGVEERKKKKKTFKRAWLCSYSYNTKGYISSLLVYFNSWQGRPYLLHASVPSKSHSEITRTTAKHLPGI